MKKKTYKFSKICMRSLTRNPPIDQRNRKERAITRLESFTRFSLSMERDKNPSQPNSWPFWMHRRPVTFYALLTFSLIDETLKKNNIEKRRESKWPDWTVTEPVRPSRTTLFPFGLIIPFFLKVLIYFYFDPWLKIFITSALNPLIFFN